MYPEGTPAIHLYHNAHFFQPEGPIREPGAMLVAGGIIAAMGDAAGLRSAYPQAVPVDLGGKTVFPGFNDGHIHLWKVGSLLGHTLDLRGMSSREELLETMRTADGSQSGNWILARGFNEAGWEDPSLPTCRDLDTLFPDRPCQVMRTCAHIAVVNSKALELAGIRRDTPDPPGGSIGRFPDGQPNGLLAETALKLVAACMPEIEEDAYRQMILDAQEKCLDMGITSVTDPEIHPAQYAAYRQLEAEGLLKLRIGLLLTFIPEFPPVALPETATEVQGKLRVEGIKCFADGGLSGQTAALERPYRNSTERGLLHMDPEKFFQRAARAQARGWRIATHAIGDAAISQVLEVYRRLKEVPGNAICHRIEHLGLPTLEHLETMRRLGVACMSQPHFVRELGPNFRRYLDAAYLAGVYPYRTLLDQGICLGFSSDAPVVRDFRPLAGIRDAVLRRDSEGFEHNQDECLEVPQALLAYTREAARAQGAETWKGSLKAGYLADFIVLNRDPRDAPLEEWDAIQIEKVYIGGICYR